MFGFKSPQAIKNQTDAQHHSKLSRFENQTDAQHNSKLSRFKNQTDAPENRLRSATDWALVSEHGFGIFRFLEDVFCEICFGNLVVRDRGKKEGVLDRTWTK